MYDNKAWSWCTGLDEQLGTHRTLLCLCHLAIVTLSHTLSYTPSHIFIPLLTHPHTSTHVSSQASFHLSSHLSSHLFSHLFSHTLSWLTPGTAYVPVVVQVVEIAPAPVKVTTTTPGTTGDDISFFSAHLLLAWHLLIEKSDLVFLFTSLVTTPSQHFLNTTFFIRHWWCTTSRWRYRRSSSEGTTTRW